MESGVDFVAADMPQANRLTVHIMAAFAEHEARAISDRTKAALAALKGRGVQLGNPRWEESLGRARKARLVQIPQPPAPVIEMIQKLRMEGGTLRSVAGRLNALGLRTPRGGMACKQRACGGDSWYSGSEGGACKQHCRRAFAHIAIISVMRCSTKSASKPQRSKVCAIKSITARPESTSVDRQNLEYSTMPRKHDWARSQKAEAERCYRRDDSAHAPVISYLPRHPRKIERVGRPNPARRQVALQQRYAA